MFVSPLHDVLVRAGARLGEFGGVQTAASFAGIPDELHALESGCALSDLSWRALITVRGDDRVRWLNGMVTNNVKDLPRDRGCYNFVLNAQGRIQGDFTTFNLGDTLAIATDRSQVESMLKLLDGYIIMDDVQLEDFSKGLTVIGIDGPRAAASLTALGFKLPASDLELAVQTFEGCELTLVKTDVENSFELWVMPDSAIKLWETLMRSGATPCGFEAQEVHRIRLGRPRYGVDIRSRDLPQETEQTRALNFQKGCYVGQEIVERIRSQGKVHRRFTQFRLDQTVAPGTHIELAGKQVGEITSVAQLPDGEILALGYIRREAENARELTAGAASVALREAAVGI